MPLSFRRLLLGFSYFLLLFCEFVFIFAGFFLWGEDWVLHRPHSAPFMHALLDFTSRTRDWLGWGKELGAGWVLIWTLVLLSTIGALIVMIVVDRYQRNYWQTRQSLKALAQRSALKVSSPTNDENKTSSLKL